jgi:hypothetical protein
MIADVALLVGNSIEKVPLETVLFPPKDTTATALLETDEL